MKSRPTMTGFVPNWSLTADQRRPSPMVASARSTWKASGTFSGSAMTSTSRRTTFSTPPALMPGQVSSCRKVTGTFTRMREPGARRWKSTWIGRSVTGWNCTSRIRQRSAPPFTATSYRCDCQPPLCSSFITTRGSRASSVASFFAP